MSDAIDLTVATRVRQVLAESLGWSLERVRPEHRFLVDLGMDSLDVVETVMNLEDDLQISIPDDDVARLTTVAEAIAYVERALAQKRVADA